MKWLLPVFFWLLVMPAPADARDQIHIVSSSTVYPFAGLVAEHFGKSSGFRAPVIESTGSGGGFKLFCASIDADSPDIVGASRPIAKSEAKDCAAHEVGLIGEIVIGFDGIALVNAKSAHPYQLTRRQLFLAIAKTVPRDGKLIANPYARWSEIDPALPSDPILVFGPAPNHGTRDVLLDLVMERSCQAFPEISGLEPIARKQVCEHLREDGHFIEVSENYTIILRKLVGEPNALGILPFSYLDQNGDKIQAATLEGFVPSYDNIYNLSYPLARPLFLYVKTSHIPVTHGILEYLTEFLSEKACGKDGYLADHGLIVLSEAARQVEREKLEAWRHR